MLLALIAAGLAAQPDERVLHARNVAGWQVERIAESDGGEVVRMRRRGRNFGLLHQAIFWRGNGGPLIGDEFSFGSCVSGDAPAHMNPGGDFDRAIARSRIDDYLAECGVPQARGGEMMRGFDAAFALFGRWGRDAQACTAAENARIANHGAAPGERVPIPRCGA